MAQLWCVLPGRASHNLPLVAHFASAAVLQSLCSLGSPHWGSHVAGLSSSSSSSCHCPRPFSTTPSNPSSNINSSEGSASGTSTSATGSSSSNTTPEKQQATAHVWQRAELRAVRAQVFEHHLGNGQRSGRKAILKPLKGRFIADWYFTLTGPKRPMLLDDVEEERQARVETARATGGGPPKKGQGKRAKK